MNSWSPRKLCSVIVAAGAAVAFGSLLGCVDANNLSKKSGEVAGGVAQTQSTPGTNTPTGGGERSSGNNEQTLPGGEGPGTGSGNIVPPTGRPLGLACHDAASNPIPNAFCDPIDNTCRDANGVALTGALCVDTVVICIDALGTEIPGATCGVNNLCVDNAGNIIEGTCVETTIPLCPPGLTLSTSTSTSISDSMSTSTSLSTSVSCSTSLSTSLSTSDDPANTGGTGGGL